MFNIREGGYKSLCQPFSWSMAATLSNSIIAICVHPQAIPLAMIDPTENQFMGFFSQSYMGMRLHLAALWVASFLL